MRARFSRRSFVAGLNVTAASLVLPFLEKEAAAQAQTRGPLRLLVMQTPDGMPGALWQPNATGSNFNFGPSMKPYEALKSDLVVLKGIRHLAGGGEPHCQALVQWMTGAAGTTTDNYTAAGRASIDQLLAANANFVGATPFKSLQMAADMSTIPNDVSHRYLSWSGANKPLPAEHRPLQNYARLFAEFAQGQNPDDGRARLIKLMKERRSILDLVVKSDAKRMMSAVPSEQKPYFEAHLAAIRSLEDKLSAPLPPLSQCQPINTSAFPTLDADSNKALPDFWKANTEVLKLALVCDRTRVVTFLSSPSTSNVVHFDWAPGMKSRAHHHDSTHQDNMENLAAINLWYSQRIADFMTSLKNTNDGSHKLLDNMLVMVASEFGSEGSHSTTNIPCLLFGSAGGNLQGGRSLAFSAGRSSNDLWLSCLSLLQMPQATVGDPTKCTGPLPGLT
jgi:Protein of unknown function (DUF1552)